MRRHPFDLAAFVWGLIFLVGAGGILLDESGWASFDVRWVLPTGLVLLGVSGMASALRSSRG